MVLVLPGGAAISQQGDLLVSVLQCTALQQASQAFLSAPPAHVKRPSLYVSQCEAAFWASGAWSGPLMLGSQVGMLPHAVSYS